jgi:hypothetical protein
MFVPTRRCKFCLCSPSTVGRVWKFGSCGSCRSEITDLAPLGEFSIGGELTDGSYIAKFGYTEYRRFKEIELGYSPEMTDLQYEKSQYWLQERYK